MCGPRGKRGARGASHSQAPRARLATGSGRGGGRNQKGQVVLRWGSPIFSIRGAFYITFTSH